MSKIKTVYQIFLGCLYFTGLAVMGYLIILLAGILT